MQLFSMIQFNKWKQIKKKLKLFLSPLQYLILKILY